MASPSQMFVALAATASVASAAHAANPNDPFAKLAAARAAAPAVTMPLSAEHEEKAKTGAQRVAKNALKSLADLGKQIESPDSQCVNLNVTYGAQQSLLGVQVDLAGGARTAHARLDILEGALKEHKVEDAFKATGAALAKRCPNENGPN